MRARAVARLELRAQLVMQMRKRLGTRGERLVLDHPQSRHQLVIAVPAGTGAVRVGGVLLRRCVVVLAHASEYSRASTSSA